jgi:hypothetical protein
MIFNRVTEMMFATEVLKQLWRQRLQAMKAPTNRYTGAPHRQRWQVHLLLNSGAPEAFATIACPHSRVPISLHIFPISLFGVKAFEL